MNIAYVVHRFAQDEGTGRYTVELVRRAAPRHRVTVYAATIAADVPPGVEVVKVPAVMTRAYTAILSFPAAFRLVRRRHDLVHAQGWVTTRADVVTAHIVLAAWRAATSSAGVPSATGERVFGGFVAGRERNLLRRVHAVIAPSRAAAQDIARYTGRTEGVHVIPHGFPGPSKPPDRATARERLGLPPDAFIGLYAGDPRKGLEAAVRAIAGAAEGAGGAERQESGVAVHLAVASHASVSAVRETAARAGVADRVHPLGAVRDMSLAYAAADVLVHPSIYDTFGLVVAEAIAQGLPTVVTRAAGISELLRHGESAWVLRAPDPQDVAAALTTLAREPARRVHLARGAWAVARKRGWDEVARETLALYEGIAAQ